MCDLLCYTSLAVFEAARRVKWTHRMKSYMKTREK